MRIIRIKLLVFQSAFRIPKSKISMILRQFPGRNHDEARSDYVHFGQSNVVVIARARHIAYTRHTAPLSIKTTLKGCETYEVEGQRINVDEDSYLVLNNEQLYASHIESSEEVESFCVFFRDRFAEEVLTPFITPAERLLDDPELKSGQPVVFFQKLNRHDRTISPLLARLHHGINAGLASGLWLDEQFHALARGLLCAHRESCAEVSRLAALRLSTRVELYRRLTRARDFLDSCYAEHLTLARVAHEACLSEHYFLRLFHQAFRTTPHSYLTERRLRKAQQLLKNPELSILEICLSVGFENPSAFARLFRRRFGTSPREMRRLK